MNDLLEKYLSEVKDKRLYTKEGYVNLPFILSSGCPFICLIGPRGTGKTYTILDYYREKDEYLLYMRRTQAAIDSCGLPDLSPYMPINQDKGERIVPKSAKEGLVFWRSHIEKDSKGKEIEVLDSKVSMGLAFSTFYNKRSLGGNIFGTVFFDEIIKEPLEKSMKNEGKAFLNMCETINRNKELKGEKPTQFILAGNSDCLDSQILQSIGAVSIIEKMIASGQVTYINKNKGLAIFMLNDSPIARLKENTTLYKIANNNDFVDMALHNVFTDVRDAKDIAPAPLNELEPILLLNNRLVIYEHKSNGNWYIKRKKSGSPLSLNLNVPEDRLYWKKHFRNSILFKQISHQLFYDSFDIKVEFGGLTDL